MKKVVFRDLKITFENNRANICGLITLRDNFSEADIIIIKGILKDITNTEGLQEVKIKGNRIFGNLRVGDY